MLRLGRARRGAPWWCTRPQVDFGVGAEIAARLHDELFGQLLAPVERVGAARSPVPFSKALETAYLPTAARISAAILQTLD